MDPKFRSSFIPKKPLSVKSTGKIKRHHSFNLIVFLAGLLFIAALGLSGGAFVYERILDERVDQKGIQLSNEKNNLNLGNIEEYKSLSMRLQVAQSLINSHKALSKLFYTLNEETLHNVAYTGFSVSDSLDGANVKIKINGQAASFNALTVQSDVFKRNSMIKDFSFTDISLATNGAVTFSIEAELVGSKLLYTN